MLEQLRRLKCHGLPIFICENGICSQDDDQRIRFIQSHLEQVRHAISEKIDVGGYFYWSLLDNFEWAHGFDPRFGIVKVDYKSQERKKSNGETCTASSQCPGKKRCKVS